MDRKEIVKMLSKHFGVKPKYLGAPSFIYHFEASNGVYSVDQAGKVTDPQGDEVELQSLLHGSPADGVVASVESEAPADPDGAVDPEVLADSVLPDAPTDPEMLSQAERSAEHETAARPEAPAAPEASDEPTTPVEQKTPTVSASPATPNAESSIHDLEITVPLDSHSGFTLRNLVNLIYSRQALIAKAVGYDGNIIEEPFIAAINDQTIDTNEKLMEKISEVGNFCPGITFDFDTRTITFKFFQGEQTVEKVQAYTLFVDVLNQTAKTLKYASTKSKETENDKFTFRLFLIRLGMVGALYKSTRKILLDRLEGNSAFRNGKPEKENTETTAHKS
ncbi:hypothetical protein J41TS12_37180 [Paenibacillus antibioticophila]|uniref:Virulence-related protein n=1 Tax=Paenibacillus antibioticophila TaxID=1274374 RepID=A0A919XYC5_9BACL|nr:hypothetical protein [Paenibacillus antibioticophila]GIO38857.1 hypothetical protein J41TS12_37180 [Paenibacillus antibioticophila]